MKANEKVLTVRPVWLFSSGPQGEGDPVKLTESWRFPNAMRTIGGCVYSRDITVLHGNVKMKKVNFLEKWMIKDILRKMAQFMQNRSLMDDAQGTILLMNWKGRNEIRLFQVPPEAVNVFKNY